VGQRRLPARRRARPRLRRAGHRPLPHRAHVLRGGSAADRAPHDPQRHAATAAKARADADRSDEDREAIRTFDEALASLEALQTDDFAGLFRAMDGLPVVIRLIDPPLHEFLPSHDELVAETTRLRTTLELTGGTNGIDAGLVQQGLVKLFGKKDAARAMRKLNLSAPERGGTASAPVDRSGLERELAEKTELLHAVEAMREQNPMLGLRGVRLGLMVPDIVKMQTRAILAGAARVAAEGDAAARDHDPARRARERADTSSAP
jgi:phosphoenolpyruvate synthase/pyruvate phosphate dikinase